jgi:hypothetical protein
MLIGLWKSCVEDLFAIDLWRVKVLSRVPYSFFADAQCYCVGWLD